MNVSHPTAAPVALVTGAARRIGAGIARRLHTDGWRLALHYHASHAGMQALCAELDAHRPGSVIALHADLAQPDAATALVTRALAHFGRLDGLVNNASAFHPTPSGAITPAQIETLFAINTCAPLFLSQAAAPHLRAASGAIVNLIDVYAERPLRAHLAYGMSKAALAYQTRALALELAPDVRVNGIAPGAILWPDTGKPEADRRALLARVPLARTGTVEEIAEATAWLLRQARYTTGQVIAVDGGRLLEA